MPRTPKTYILCPSMHDEVASLLIPHNLNFTFHPIDDKQTINLYDTNVMGYFACRNPRCKSKGWGSKRIAISIRQYPGNKYNVQVWAQRCRICDTLATPRPDASYAERVAYRLKKWSGVQQPKPMYTGKKGLPHERALCEGCKAGRCSAMWD